MPRAALVTAETLPIGAYDAPLVEGALAEKGIELDHPVWSDPAVDWGIYDAVVIGSAWDYHRRLPEFLAWTQRVNNMTRLFNIPRFVEWNCRKTYLNEMAVAGMNVVPTLKIGPSSHYTLSRLMGVLGARKLVAKPLVGAGAEGIRVFGPEEGEAFLAAKAEGEFLAQPYLEAIETEGEISLVMIDGAFSHAILKRAAPGDFRVQEEHGGSVDLWQPSDSELEVAAIAMAILPERPLYARVDLVWISDRPAVMELELIEPDLYLRWHEPSAGALAEALAKRI